MIGKLRGVICEKEEDHIILDVNGVGYIVFLTIRQLANLAKDDQLISLYIETQQREDSIRLYGFTTKLEKEWFRLLLSVQGVGAKVALALLGTLTPGELANALALRDAALIAQAPGIGKKVAERIISELKNKAPKVMTLANNELSPIRAIAVESTNVIDAVSALINLGYSRDQAGNAVAAALTKDGEHADSSTLIKLGLKELAR